MAPPDNRWALKARELLAEYRQTESARICSGSDGSMRDIHLGQERADRLEQAIADALYDAFNADSAGGTGFK